MKIQTIHTNALGRVLNETNATGFRITDDQGLVVELHSDMTIHVRGAIFTVEHLENIVRAHQIRPRGKSVTNMIVDETHD
jgi:hypothetical protein